MDGIPILYLIVLIIILCCFGIVMFLSSSRKRAHRRQLAIDHEIPYKDEDISYSIFLIGDAGAVSVHDNDKVFSQLGKELQECGEKSAIVFLGDNIYPAGLPDTFESKRKRAEERIQAQLDMLKGYDGKVYYLGGNHDWNRGRKGGWEAIIRQEKYIEEKLGRGNVFLPDNGCLGPVKIDLPENICLVIINTQWWVQDGLRPMGAKDGCTVSTEKDFFASFSRMLRENRDKKIVVAAHHPLYSNALHGGKFTPKQHIFPLTDVNKKFYIPFPVVGSLYPLYRMVYGAREDISHPAYRRMRKKLLKCMAEAKDAIYAAGHDHNLQHIYKHHNHYLVSGSGSKVAFVKKGGKASFAMAEKGYFRVNYLKNGETWLEAWIVGRDFPDGKLVYVADVSSSALSAADQSQTGEIPD